MERARWIGLGALGFAALACATPDAPSGGRAANRPTAPAGGKGDGKGQVVVGPGAFKDGATVLSAWIAYAGGKVAQYDKQHPPPANESGDDFATELAGRTAMSAFWEKNRDKPRAAFDRQVQIWRAGFLPEFVVAVHARPGWTVPGSTVAALRLEEFFTKFAGDYAPGAPAAIKPQSGKLVPDVPGADFPDPRRLPVAPASCRAARDERRAAWERWTQIAPRLGGVAISASSTVQFGRQLAALKRDAQGAPPDVTWVSERVGHLALLDGYCAVEARNWPLAVEMLTRAVSLTPANPDPHLELSGALTMSGRQAEALPHADWVIANSNDGCAVGRGWRRRGYILVEMEAFEAARRAYEKSLEVDPGNPIALSELKTIATAMKQPGNWRTKPQPGQPPFDPVVLTGCREGKSVEK